MCPNILTLSLYWNVGLSDDTIKHAVKNCQKIIYLNLSSCKNITDWSLLLIPDSYPGSEKLNITSFTDKVYREIGSLTNMRFLDLCVALNVTNKGVSCIARCRNLTSLNLTCLFGVVGVTDACLEALWKSCLNTLCTLDVNGCIGIKRSREDLFLLFPRLTCFKVHS